MRQALVVRFSSRFFLCCAILLIGSRAFAQRPKVLAPHVPVAPKMAKRHPLAPSTLQSAVGGLWMTGPSMKSSLYLTNGLKTDALTITPILHLSNGLQYSLNPVTLQPQETAIVDVNEALAKHGIAPYATLYGYAEIQYQWPWAIVCATVRNVDVAHSLLFNFAMQPPPDSFPTFGVPAKANGPQSLEGMWWKQEPGVSGFLGFSNVSGRPISASLRLTDNQGVDLETYHLVVPPHGTKMVNFTQILSASAATGGIYVAYDGPPHTLAINGGLQDLTAGYSAQLRLQPSPQVSPTTVQPELSEITFSELGLMSGPADPMMMFPAGTMFTPYSVVRNISEQAASVTPTLWWMAGGAPRSAELPAVTIAPHRTVNLDVPSLIAAAGMQNFSGSLNVVLDTKAQPGALALASGSVDQTNTYVFEVSPHGIGESGSKSLSYWSTGNGDDSMVTVWNPADEPQDFVFTLFYSAGQYAFPLHLEPRATRVFNISELIRNQTPDAQGSTIPLAVHEGSAEIAGSQGENQMVLVAMDSGIYNVRKATCSPTCITCNGVASASVVDNPFAAPVGGTYPLTFYGQWNTGDQYNFTNQSAWASSDASIATVGSGNGLVTGVSPGNVSMSVQDNYSEALYVSYYCYFVGPNCPVQRPGGSGSGTVRVLYASRLINTQYSRAMSCPTGTAGWDRRVTEIIVDQNGQDFTYDGVSLTENITTGRNDLSLSCANPQSQCSGSATTSGGGTYPDEFYFCSAACPASGGETDVTQVIFYNGIAVHSPNVVVYKCGQIMWNAQ